ncbi:hypothetical protein AB0I53_39145 [Saccharopolyspora sp. NPDC050389]
MADDTRELHGHCVAHGQRASLTEYVGGHEFICWRGCLADGLQELTRP